MNEEDMAEIAKLIYLTLTDFDAKKAEEYLDEALQRFEEEHKKKNNKSNLFLTASS